MAGMETMTDHGMLVDLGRRRRLGAWDGPDGPGRHRDAAPEATEE